MVLLREQSKVFVRGLEEKAGARGEKEMSTNIQSYHVIVSTTCLVEWLYVPSVVTFPSINCYPCNTEGFLLGMNMHQGFFQNYYQYKD